MNLPFGASMALLFALGVLFGLGAAFERRFRPAVLLTLFGVWTVVTIAVGEGMIRELRVDRSQKGFLTMGPVAIGIGLTMAITRMIRDSTTRRRQRSKRTPPPR